MIKNSNDERCTRTSTSSYNRSEGAEYVPSFYFVYR